MNCIILAGGKGSRLATIWDKPKCLIPILGAPLIYHLIARCLELKPNRIFLALGHGAEEVMDAIYAEPNFRLEQIAFSVNVDGTASAVRQVLAMPLPAPVMVINGDTLPYYPFGDYVEWHHRLDPLYSSATWHNGVNAGQAIINARGIADILSDTMRFDFWDYLIGSARCYVPGFLDVGTPADFYRAVSLQKLP